MAGDFSVTVDLYLWKRLKNDDDDDDDDNEYVLIEQALKIKYTEITYLLYATTALEELWPPSNEGFFI